jgi:hypothetical protein
MSTWAEQLLGPGLVSKARRPPDEHDGRREGSAPGLSGPADRRLCVRELARYLLEHIQLDFEGGITLDQVRQFLREDDSREARLLLSKLIEDKGVDDLLVTIADILRDYIQTGINEEVVREQLGVYSES